MPDNRFPWRDIYSDDAWRRILEITNSTAIADLSKLTKLIESYHQVPKDKLDAIASRRAQLQAVAVESQGLIEGKGIPTDKNGKKKYESRVGGDYIKNLGPWLASLARRCRKKSDYLVTIEEFERDYGRSESSSSAASYLKYLNKVQQRRAKDTNMHLTSGNRMERLDPLHRGGAELELFGDNYIQATSNPLSRALVDWLDADSKTPFFLWLEYHPVCVASPGLDRLWDESHRTVKKTSYPPNVGELYVLTVRSSQLWSIGASLEQGKSERVFDTSDAKIVKGVVSSRGQYAFAWSTDNQIYSAPHKAGTLHHSSFTQGYKVKAAGMWGVSAQGKVVYVDDNTGHYHTDAFHLYDFLDLLNKKNVLDQNAVVLARGLGEHACPVDRFLKLYQNPASRGELKAKVKTSQVKLPGKGAGTVASSPAGAQGNPAPAGIFANIAAFTPPVKKKTV